jgi:hypothetical protein
MEVKMFGDERNATEAQLQYLAALGVVIVPPISRAHASRLIETALRERRARPATARQRSFLELRGRWRVGMSMGCASDLIRHIKAEERGGGSRPRRIRLE